MNLYPWQTECLTAWHKAGCRGIADVVTGAGKTMLALAAAAQLRAQYADLQVFILVPTIALARQWRHAIQQNLPRNFFARIGQFGGGRFDHKDCDCLIYVVNSARDALPAHLLSAMKEGKYAFLIADECHRYGSPENLRCFSFLSSPSFRPDLYASLGLSATPRPNRSVQSDAALGRAIYSYCLRDALRDGIISPCLLYGIAVHFSSPERARYAELSDALGVLTQRLLANYPFLKALLRSGSSRLEFFLTVRKIAAEEDDPESLPAQYLSLVYERSIVIRSAQSRISCVLSLLARIDPAQKVILFCERIDQSDQLYRLLNARYPGRVSHYHSALSREVRRNSLRLFREGETRILVTCKALDEGIDVPDASVGIDVSSTGVRRQRIQRLGRILRKAPGKNFATLYYLYVQESSEDSNYLIGEDDAVLSTQTQPDCPDSSPLSTRREMPVCFLNYLEAEDTFLFPEYEEAAAAAASKLLQAMHPARANKPDAPDAEVPLPDTAPPVQSGADPAKHSVTRTFPDPRRHELAACLDEGIVRPDWLLPEDQIIQHLQNVTSTHERNYWICMKQTARAHRENSDRISSD